VAPLDRHLSQPLIPGLNAIEGVHPGVYRWQQLQTRSPLGLIGEARARGRRGAAGSGHRRNPYPQNVDGRPIGTAAPHKEALR